MGKHELCKLLEYLEDLWEPSRLPLDTFLERLRKQGRGLSEEPDRGGERPGLGLENRQSLELTARAGLPLEAEILRTALQANPSVFGGCETGAALFSDCIALGNDWGFYASAVLVARRWAVTAGHVHALGLRKRVFSGNEVPDPYLGLDGKVVTVAASQRLETFIGEPYFRDDIALLELAQEVKVPTIPIASREELDRAKLGVVVGYGATDPDSGAGYGTRRWAIIPILPRPGSGRADGGSDCGDRYGGRARAPRSLARVYVVSEPDPQRYPETRCGGEYAEYDPDKEFVAAAPLRDMDACMGDSGGGFYIWSGGKLRLAGLVSRQFGSYGGRLCGTGSVYLRLHAYEDWICRSIGEADPHSRRCIPKHKGCLATLPSFSSAG